MRIFRINKLPAGYGYTIGKGKGCLYVDKILKEGEDFSFLDDLDEDDRIFTLDENDRIYLTSKYDNTWVKLEHLVELVEPIIGGE